VCADGYEIKGDECICSGGFFNYNGNCQELCPTGFYPDTNTMKCEMCVEINIWCNECPEGLIPSDVDPT
jgi:hypothetical protein